MKNKIWSKILFFKNIQKINNKYNKKYFNIIEIIKVK